MRSIILASATRFIISILLLFSIFILIRGHNEPGGGFIGGLVASSSYALYSIAFGIEFARKNFFCEPRKLIVFGFTLATCSGFIGFYFNKPFLTSVWYKLPLPVIGKLGTPFIFDVGVYCVVSGVVLLTIFTLAED